MLLTLIPAALVIVQPDLGSGLVYIVVGLAVLFVAGASWRHFAALFALFAVAITFTLVVAPKAGVTVLHGYQKDRLTAFLNPTDNPAKQGYQQNQSRIAIGSGACGIAPPRRVQLPSITPTSCSPSWANVGLHRRAFVFGCTRWPWRGLRIPTSQEPPGALIAGGGLCSLQVSLSTWA
jgi:hypothetical protein